MRSVPGLAVFVVLVLAAGYSGSMFGPGTWYAALTKPPLNPPDWVFAPVWTVLYLAIAVAAWRVWRTGQAVALPLALWLAQLAANALWSYLFFGIERPDLAFVDILVLLALAIATAVAFKRRDRLAGWLMVPYAAWVSFATYLNAGIWYLNS